MLCANANVVARPSLPLRNFTSHVSREMLAFTSTHPANQVRLQGTERLVGAFHSQNPVSTPTRHAGPAAPGTALPTSQPLETAECENRSAERAPVADQSLCCRNTEWGAKGGPCNTMSPQRGEVSVEGRLLPESFHTTEEHVPLKCLETARSSQ